MMSKGPWRQLSNALILKALSTQCTNVLPDETSPPIFYDLHLQHIVPYGIIALPHVAIFIITIPKKLEKLLVYR